MRILPQSPAVLSGAALHAVTLVAAGETEQELRLVKERLLILETEAKKTDFSGAALQAAKNAAAETAERELLTVTERIDALEKKIQKLPEVIAPLTQTISSETMEHHWNRLNERIQAIENRPIAPAAPADLTDVTPLIQQLKTDFAAQLKAAAGFEKTFQSIEERLHSCEQAPRLLAVTFMKEAENRLQTELAASEKRIGERLDKVSEAVHAKPPAERVVEASASAPELDWESRFESHEKILSELMKEIAIASKPMKASIPVGIPAVAPDLQFESTPKPFQTSAPDFGSDQSLDIDWKPNESDGASPSLATRLWYYLNEPAFKTHRHFYDRRPHE